MVKKAHGGTVRAATAEGGLGEATWRSRFRELRHEADARRRRKTLSRLFDAIRDGGEPFTVRDLQDALRADGRGPVLAVNELAGYVRILARVGAIVLEVGRENPVMQECRMSLDEGIRSVASLILRYETNMVEWLVECAGDVELGAADVATVLGLDSRCAEDLAWCLGLLDKAGGIAEIGQPAADRPAHAAAEDVPGDIDGS